MKTKRVVYNDETGEILETTEHKAWLAFAETPPIFLVILPGKKGTMVQVEIDAKELLAELLKKVTFG